MPSTFWGAAGAMLGPPPDAPPPQAGQGEDVKVVVGGSAKPAGSS